MKNFDPSLQCYFKMVDLNMRKENNTFFFQSVMAVFGHN